MSEDINKMNYLIIKGAVYDLPEPGRSEVLKEYEELKQKVDKNPLLGLAIALVGAELNK